jgi:hypothetical protein
MPSHLTFRISAPCFRSACHFSRPKQVSERRIIHVVPPAFWALFYGVRNKYRRDIFCNVVPTAFPDPLKTEARNRTCNPLMDVVPIGIPTRGGTSIVETRGFRPEIGCSAIELLGRRNRCPAPTLPITRATCLTPLFCSQRASHRLSPSVQRSLFLYHR